MKTKKRILSALFAVLLMVSIFPSGTFAEEPEDGAATVTTQNEFLDALADDTVTHIIAKEVDLYVEQGIELTKDLTIDETASLTVRDNGLLIVHSGKTLTLNGDAIIRDSGELRIGGKLEIAENAKLFVGSAMTAVAPAEIENNGSVVIGDDPERGFGRISLFDIISEGDPDPKNIRIENVTLVGKPLGGEGGHISRIADVNGPNSLDYAMDDSSYDSIQISTFHDTQDPEDGVDVTYPGDLTVTKPMDILENDSLTVTGNLTISEPGGELVIDGTLDVNGGLTNNNIMYIGGILNIGGEGINNSYYMLSPRGTINNDGAELLITGSVGADYSRGYYVETQADWDAAVADKAHCYEILIGVEASDGDAIVVSDAVELTSNLRVEGELTIEKEASLTLSRRFDHEMPYAYDEGNHIYGTVINDGTLNADIWMDICGTLENNGIINLAGYGEDESGNWITDGHIFLYSFFNEAGEPYWEGLLENAGIINNRNFISINNSSSLENQPSGEIYNYGEITQWFRDEGAQFPLENRGLIYGRVDLDYTHLCYQWLDRDEDKFFEPKEVNTDSHFVEQPSHTANVLFMVYDYDSDQGEWVYTPIGHDELIVDPFDEMDPENPIFKIEAIPEKDVSDNAELTANKDKYATVHFLDWGKNLMGYRNGTGEDAPIYLLPVMVRLPELGFYSSAEVPPTTASYINTFGGFAYEPNSEPENRTFYMIADIDDKILNSDPSFEYGIIEGMGKVSVEPTYDDSSEPAGDKRVCKVAIKDNVYGSFPLNIRLTVRNDEEVIWEGERFIWIEEEESEGLVFAWPDWRDGQNGDYRFNYPILQENHIGYETNANIGIGGATVAFFFRHQDGGGNWVYEPLSAGQLSVVQDNSGIELKEWEDLEAGDIPGNDPDHAGPEEANYKFTQMDAAKFGNYTLRYTVESGSEQVDYDLPITVRLPDVAFYSNPDATEENYIKDFTYSPEDRIFYMIAKPDFEVWEGVTSEYEIYDGDDKFDVAPALTVGVYAVTVKEGVFGDARFHGKIRLLDEGNERWSSDRDIFVNEAETEGLVYRNLDWDNGHFENGDWGLETRLNADPRGHVGIFYKKESAGEGRWNYTPVDVQFDDGNMTVSPLEPEQVYSGGDGSKNVDNAAYYRSIIFKNLGSFNINYAESDGQGGEKTFTLPVNVDLPSLGAYRSTDKNMDNWLREVDFAEYREALLIPHGVNMANVDLSKSEFRANGAILVYDSDNDVFLWSEGIDGVKLRVEPYREEGLIKHFTATVLLTPFAADFDLEIRLRDGEGREIAGNNIRFMSSLPDVDVGNTGIVLETPVATGSVNDTTVTLPNVPASSVHYATFVSGVLGDSGYLLQLTGDSTGARLYLFDENWTLIDQSAFENLSEEGRSAAIWTTGLTPGQTYYLAAHNESDLASTMQLFAGLRSTPDVPVITLEHSDQGTLGLEVSGAAEGQRYILFVKIDGEWKDRGWEPFDEEQEPRFVHAFDLLNDGETATAFAAAIGQDGIWGERAEIDVSVTRSDTQTGGLDVTRMEIPDINRIYLRTGDSDTVFANGAYMRFHHEGADGRWDYHASLFGDGSRVAQGDAFVDAEGVAAGGTWILAEYTESGGGGTYTIGWKTYIDTGKNLGQLTEGIFDIFLCNIESETRKVNASLEIYTTASGSFDCIFALYDEDGRMVDIGIQKGVEPAPGETLSEDLFYPEGKTVKWCKLFLLNEDIEPIVENFSKSL